jgi:hypothetical protein
MLRVTVEVVPHRIGLQRVQPGDIGEYVSKIQTDIAGRVLNEVVYLNHDRAEGALELVRKCVVAHNDPDAAVTDKLACAACGSEDLIGIEYSLDHPNHYDGISEWQCHCGARTGRWSGRLLGEKESEMHY